MDVMDIILLYQKDKFSDSKVKFRQTSNRCKRVLEAAKLAYANKTKESITSQKRGSRDFWRIANSVLDKGKSARSTAKNYRPVSFFSMVSKVFEKLVNNGLFITWRNVTFFLISVWF